VKLHKGFTLIELLVVISIIGVLSSIVLASMNSAREKAKLTKAYATMVQLNNAAFSCMTDGIALNSFAQSSNPGVQICAGGVMLPDLTDIGFTYCGTGCGGWNGDSSQYGISIYSYTYASGNKIVTCSTGENLSGWYVGSTGGNYTPWNFSQGTGCAKYGF